MPKRSAVVTSPWGVKSPVEASGRWCEYSERGCACQFGDVDQEQTGGGKTTGFLQEALRSGNSCPAPDTPEYVSEGAMSEDVNRTKCTGSRFKPIYKWSPMYNTACGEAQQDNVLRLACEDGRVLGKVKFASFGRPDGRS